MFRHDARTKNPRNLGLNHPPLLIYSRPFPGGDIATNLSFAEDAR